MSRKLLTVIGATGNQGSSVIKSVLEHPKLSQEFTIRAVTRDVSKPAAVALKEKGVEVVAADLNDKQSVIDAVKGTHTLFGMTNFGETKSHEIETTQGKNQADAAKAANVSHFIFSSLPSPKKVTNGTLVNVSHFESKASVADYIDSLGIPHTRWQPAVYSTTYAAMMIRKVPSGDAYGMALPFPETTKIPMLDPGYDTGKFVAAIILAGKPQPKPVFGCTGWYTPKDLLAAVEEITGKKGYYTELQPEQFKGFLPPEVALDILENMLLIKDYKYYGQDAEDRVKESLEILQGEKTATLLESLKGLPWE